MVGIRSNIAASAILHTLMFAAAFVAGSSSELRKTRVIAVSLIEEWGIKTAGQRAEAPQNKILQKSLSKGVSSNNHAEHDDLPVMPRQNADTTPVSAPLIEQALPSQSRDIMPMVGPMHTGESPVIGGTVSRSGFGITAISPGASTGANANAAAHSGGQKIESTGNASLRQTIRALLQANLVYPYIARKRQMEGSVMVSFRINQAGNPETIRILKGSGYSILDSAAQETVVKASPFPVANSVIEVPITFTLQNRR